MPIDILMEHPRLSNLEKNDLYYRKTSLTHVPSGKIGLPGFLYDVQTKTSLFFREKILQLGVVD